jgi:four helix bundle protein
MSENQKPKQYDLEDRTLQFAKDVREFVRKLSRSAANIEDVHQLIRSSGSVGANYYRGKRGTQQEGFCS